MEAKRRGSADVALKLAGLFEELKGMDLAPDTLGQRLRPFFDHRAEAVAFLLGQFESEDEEGLALATSALRAMDDPSLVPRLLNLLRSSRVDALAKGLLLILLEHYGVDLHDQSLIGTSLDVQDLLKGPSPPRRTE